MAKASRRILGWLFADPRAIRRFRKNRGATAGLILVVLVSGTALLGPWLAPHDPEEQNLEELLHDNGLPYGPGEAPGHLLGADTMGRDELSRLLYGGAVDAVSMRFVDVLLSLPFLLIVIAIQRVIDTPDLWVLFLILGCLSWTTLARVTRAKTMQVRELEYVQAARALGMGHGRIVLRHVLPNVLGPAIVIGTTLVAQMIIAESAMSFLGFGVQAPQASWGSMLREGQQYLSHAPRLVLFSGLLIMATVFGFNLLGEGLRDAFDPKD
jgi:ABC-type dipeptide/oligopeptide/nickel transport system permease subunit